ncbi:hypothetical protein NC651_001020 [Populus alba x Populus x berolinensis]|nr:hypothetical protein NC651_001020 [Populus alba x Populus x berolinensis]
MEEARAEPVCAVEALDLLNCVAQTPYDQDKCVRHLQVLRHCVLIKKVKKFSLTDPEQQEANSVSKKA